MALSDPAVHEVRIVLALDLGSTNLKAALFHAARGCIAEGSAAVAYTINETSSAGDSRVELDGEALWATVVSLISETCRRGVIAPNEIDRIGIASQAQTFALMDAEGGLLHPFVSWLDTRGAPYAGDIAETLGADFHAHCSFSSGMSEMQLSKVLWYRRRAPAMLGRAASVILLPSYVMYRLGGLNLTDPNVAAMSGLYSLQRGDWWDEALTLCGIGPDRLPELAPLGTPLRTTTLCPELPLREDLEIVLAGNDQTAGAFGNGCGPGDMVATLGTALVVYRYAGAAPGPYSHLGCWGPYPGGGWYELGVRNHGCLALDWAREELMPGAGVEAFVARAQGADRGPNTEAAFFYPAHMATPVAWAGSTDPARRALAVLEGIGFSLRQLIVDDLEIATQPASVTVIGGGSRSAFWLQCIADILGCPVRRGTGDARTGAAAMAVRDMPIFVKPTLCETEADGDRTYRPTAAGVQYYRALYERWRERRA